MAFDTDDFNRSNGDVGSEWTAQSGEFANVGLLQIDTNKMRGVETEQRINRFNAFSPNPSQYAQVKYIGGIADNVLNILVRDSGSVSEGYQLQINGFANEWHIMEINAGVETDKASGALTISANDVFRIEAAGTNISARQNGGLLGTHSDATFSTGQAGVSIFWGNENPALEVDDFEVGDLNTVIDVSHGQHVWEGQNVTLTSTDLSVLPVVHGQHVWEGQDIFFIFSIPGAEGSHVWSGQEISLRFVDSIQHGQHVWAGQDIALVFGGNTNLSVEPGHHVWQGMNMGLIATGQPAPAENIVQQPLRTMVKKMAFSMLDMTREAT